MENSTKMVISNERKQQIANDLKNYVQNLAGGSANKASKMLKEISNAYISHILNNKWEAISDQAWRNLENQVCRREGEWATVETRATKLLKPLLLTAKEDSQVFGVIAEPGTCKSHITTLISGELDNVYRVACNEFFNRKGFLSELLSAMGKDAGGYTVSMMMQAVISHIRKADKPLIILDEADKLTDQVLYFFITLYNSLEDQCGIVLLSTDFLEKRVEKGIRLNKKGYKEIYSRIGRKFIALPTPNEKDVTLVCQANGVTDPLHIKKIYNESEGDLRRVKRLIYSTLKKS